MYVKHLGLFYLHWWIQGAPPDGTQFFLFVYVFAEKRPHWRSAPPRPPRDPGSAATDLNGNTSHKSVICIFLILGANYPVLIGMKFETHSR